jgi:hypothetical protein
MQFRARADAGIERQSKNTSVGSRMWCRSFFTSFHVENCLVGMSYNRRKTFGGIPIIGVPL